MRRLDARGRQEAIAAIQLGAIRAEQGDRAGAATAFQRAMDSSDADLAPRAALNLGVLHAQYADWDMAAAALELAIKSRHPHEPPRAPYKLGGVPQRQ
jgi:hypothetical protein